jgi:hypothetical protein
MTTYNFADTNRSAVRYIAETQWASTPASGKSRVASITSHNLQTTKRTVTSNTIRSDRLIQDIIETEMMSDGGINFEFSAGAIDDYLQAFMLGQWSRPMTFDYVAGTEVSWTANNTLTIVGDSGYNAGVFIVGRVIKVSGFVNPNNNGFFTLATVTNNTTYTTLTVSTTTSTIEAGNAKSQIEDANDALIVNDTVIRSGTSGAAVFDSNGNNAFASAITAGQLFIGQNIHVEGLGYQTGSVVINGASNASNNTVVTISDGTNSVAFTLVTSPTAGDVTIGASAPVTAANLAVAINTARIEGWGASPGVAATFLNVNAVVAGGSGVTLTNLYAVGGSISISGGGGVTDSAFAGGDVSQHGIFKITSLNEDQIFVTPTPTTNANTTIPVTIRASTLVNPLPAEITPQSFTLESLYEDVGQFVTSTGQRVQDFTLDVNAAQVVTGAVGFMGAATVVQTSDVLGLSPYTALSAVGAEIMNATTDVGNLLENGSVLSTAIKQIKLDGKAQLRNQMAVGSKFPVGIGTGRFEMTGTMAAYFENWQEFNHFLNHDTVALQFNLSDTDERTYVWTLPAVKFTADPIHVKGIDQDVMEELSFSAFRDPATATMLQVDRFSSLIRV